MKNLRWKETKKVKRMDAPSEYNRTNPSTRCCWNLLCESFVFFPQSELSKGECSCTSNRCSCCAFPVCRVHAAASGLAQTPAPSKRQSPRRISSSHHCGLDWEKIPPPAPPSPPEFQLLPAPVNNTVSLSENNVSHEHFPFLLRRPRRPPAKVSARCNGVPHPASTSRRSQPRSWPFA